MVKLRSRKFTLSVPVLPTEEVDGDQSQRLGLRDPSSRTDSNPLIDPDYWSEESEVGDESTQRKNLDFGTIPFKVPPSVGPGPTQ